MTFTVSTSMHVTEIKQRLHDPLTVCAALKLTGKSRPQPNGIFVVCPNPMHQDDDPSCSVTVGDDGLLRFNCFGCPEGGDVLSLIGLVHGLTTRGSDFRKVLAVADELARTVPLSVTPMASRRAFRGGRRGEHRVVAEVLLELCPLSASSDVAAYLAHRRVLDRALSDGWGALPADEHELEQLVDELYLACGEDLVESSGIVRDGRLVRPGHRIAIPFRQPDGSVDLIQRRLAVDEAASQPRYLLPLGLAPAWPYGIEHLVSDDDPHSPIVFVEGCVDVLAARALADQGGLQRTVLGVPSSELWHQTWASLGAGRHVAVAVDADDAGHRLAALMRGDLIAAGAARVERWVPVGAKDWGELWRCDAARSA